MPTSQLSTSFAGKLAGVIATTKTGEPGSGADFYIRGISTFGGRTTPLILLDDVEISVSDLNYVPAENIESFSILKDASATAIYGARGANGVMIISTKGGDYNMKTKVNVSAENSFNIMSDFPEFVDGPRYMELYNEADLSRNPNKSKDQLLYSDRRIQLTRDGVNPYVYPNVDWQDVIFKKMTMTQRANINVSGGGTKVKYYMSLNVSHDSGLLNTEKAYSWNNNINIMNYTFQNNISYKLTPTTTIRMNMNAQIRQNKGPNINSADLFKMILTTTPVTFPATYPAQPGDTYIRYGSDYQSSDYLYPNPYAQMMTSYKEQNANTLNTVIKVEQDFGFEEPAPDMENFMQAQEERNPSEPSSRSKDISTGQEKSEQDLLNAPEKTEGKEKPSVRAELDQIKQEKQESAKKKEHSKNRRQNRSAGRKKRKKAKTKGR